MLTNVKQNVVILTNDKMILTTFGLLYRDIFVSDDRNNGSESADQHGTPGTEHHVAHRTNRNATFE